MTSYFILFGIIMVMILPVVSLAYEKDEKETRGIIEEKVTDVNWEICWDEEWSEDKDDDDDDVLMLH